MSVDLLSAVITAVAEKRISSHTPLHCIISQEMPITLL